MNGSTFPRRRIAALALAVLPAAVAAWLLPQWAEHRVRDDIEREAARRGWTAKISTVHVGLFPALAVGPLRFDKPGSFTVDVESARVSLRAWGSGVFGRSRLSLGRAIASGAGSTLEVAPTRWRFEREAKGGLSAVLENPGEGGLVITRRPAAAEGMEVGLEADDFQASHLLTLRRGDLLVDAGALSGSVRLTSAARATRFEAELRGRDVRLPSLSGLGAPDTPPPVGPPVDATLRLAGRWDAPASTVDLDRWQITSDGVVLEGSLRIESVSTDPRLDLNLRVERVDFGRLLASAGLDQPRAVAARATGETRDGDLGSAFLEARFRGRVSDPASFVVTQKLDFTPPRRALPAIERLKGDFTHDVITSAAERRTIDVSPASPDYISLADVPPLFVRTLLLGEDSSFFGHSGVDLTELPSAILTNWSRGEAVRGASTISQQLAKNLFLSREKNAGRKLQELCLALLLEAGLGKERMLEIYLNVIEWGPGLYGLRPASRRYFAREPGDLAPAQMALLVALIPGPVKYQRSLASGRPSPGFRPLVDGLLAKLRSIDLLSEEEYQAALQDELLVSTSEASAAESAPAAKAPTGAPPS